LFFFFFFFFLKAQIDLEYFNRTKPVFFTNLELDNSYYKS